MSLWLPPQSSYSPCLTQGEALDPLGLPYLQLSPRPQTLRFARPKVSGQAIPLLRLIIARDCRRTALLEAFIHGIPAGQLDVRIPAQWASFALDLSAVLGQDASNWPEVLEVVLRAADHPTEVSASIRASDPLPAIVVGQSELAPFSTWVGIPITTPPPLQARALADFLISSANRDYLGWMIGCVSTGLADLYEATGDGLFLNGLKQLLSGYGEGLPLESPNQTHHLGTTPAEILNSHLESFAPVAALAKLQRWEPQPERELALMDWGKRMLAVADAPQDFLTTEGCFTLAFPLAAIAKTVNKPQWSDRAAELCLERWHFLQRDATIIQRAYQDGRTYMVNWARGTAWLILGTVQTALELPSQHPARPELAKHFRHSAATLLERQRPDGLWNVFTARPDSGAETSGSAGIAAALALAVQLNWLDNSILSASQQCLTSMETYLQPDGCLGGVSQHNPASEEALQLGYRIRAAWGTGLLAQLVAAINQQGSRGAPLR